MNRHRWRQRWFHWHRRIGVLASLLVLLLAVTGVALNHTDALRLDERPVQARWLLAYYGIDVPPTVGVEWQGRWLSQQGASLFLGQTALGDCQGALVGAAALADEEWLVVCQAQLLRFDPYGQLIDSIDPLFGLPVPITSLAQGPDQVWWFAHGEQWYRLDAKQLSWSAQDSPRDLTVQRLRELPSEQQPAAGVTLLNWERVILDLHAGRLFGHAGSWLWDLLALLMVILALSGLYLWGSSQLRRRRR